MNNSIHRISLDIHETKSQVSISAKKLDKYRKLYITLKENGKPYNIADGCVAYFDAKKADGNWIHNRCTIDGNTIIYSFTRQTTAAVGTTECDIALYNADPLLDTEEKAADKITSPHFTIEVEDTVYNGEEIVSSSESDMLKEFVSKVNTEFEQTDKKLETKIETFEVTITANKDGTYAADKTYREITAAYNEGKLVSAIGISDGFHVTLSLVSVGADYIIFSLTTQKNLIDLYIGSDNTVSLTQSKMLVGTLVSKINSNSPTIDNAPSELAVVNYVNKVLSNFIDVSEVGQ